MISDPFIVHRIGGSGHNFIACLLIHLLLQDHDVIPVSDIGHSHDYYKSYVKDNLDIESVGKSLDFIDIPAYKTIKKITNNPLVIFEHRHINFLELKNTHPNFKYIFISVLPAEEINIEFNHFYKRFLFEPNDKNIYWDFYLEESVINNNIRSGLSSLKELTHPEVKELLTQKIIKYPNHVSEQNALYFKIKNDFPENVYVLEYHVIYNSMETTISKLEEITKKKRNAALVASYLKYLDNQ